MDWDEMAVVGRVARAHGNRGQVILNTETDFPEERFRAGAMLWARRAGNVERLRVTEVRFHQGRPILTLEGVQTIDEAERLAGLEIRVPLEELRPLPPDSYYHHDLVGCRVATVAAQEIGRVVRVEGTADGSRLAVDAAQGEILIPLARLICVNIDVAGRTIVIDPPEGLLDLNVGKASLL